MPIPSENFNVTIYLSELIMQCQLFERSIERLKIAAEHWINIGNSIDDGTKFSPLEIISECTVCLSVMSAVRRILFPKGELKARGEVIYNLLNRPCLEYVISNKVRNSWEHHDERIDKILSSREVGSGFSVIHVHPNPPNENQTVLKRFDPLNLSVAFSGDVIELKPCIIEIQNLRAEINSAFAKLHYQIVKI